MNRRRPIWRERHFDFFDQALLSTFSNCCDCSDCSANYLDSRSLHPCTPPRRSLLEHASWPVVARRRIVATPAASTSLSTPTENYFKTGREKGFFIAMIIFVAATINSSNCCDCSDCSANYWTMNEDGSASYCPPVCLPPCLADGSQCTEYTRSNLCTADEAACGGQAQAR